jgi:hypothetical protein
MRGVRRFLASRWDAGRFWRRGGWSGGSRSLRDLHQPANGSRPFGAIGEVQAAGEVILSEGVVALWEVALGAGWRFVKGGWVWLCDLRW